MIFMWSYHLTVWRRFLYCVDCRGVIRRIDCAPPTATTVNQPSLSYVLKFCTSSLRISRLHASELQWGFGTGPASLWDPKKFRNLGSYLTSLPHKSWVSFKERICRVSTRFFIALPIGLFTAAVNSTNSRKSRQVCMAVLRRRQEIEPSKRLDELHLRMTCRCRAYFSLSIDPRRHAIK